LLIGQPDDRKPNRLPGGAAREENVLKVKEAILRNAIEEAQPVESPGDDPDINQSEQSAYRDPAMGEIESQ